MDEPPMVSVIVAARNSEATIEACLESLLAQDYPKDRYEVIVVDNDSMDRTPERIQRFGVTCVSERTGHSAAWGRNRGLREARGEILAFTDSDCVAAPDWLRWGVAGFTSPEIGCVAGEIVAYPAKTLAERYAESRKALSQRYAMEESFKPYAQTANAFYRREALRQIGPFDTSLVIVEDADLGWRMQEELGLAVAFRPESVVYHKHRPSIRALLRQRMGYGFSAAQLYRKYRGRMPAWTIRNTWWDALTLAKKSAQCAVTMGKGIANALRGRPDWEPGVFAALDVASHLAYKLGRLKGSISYRIWYV
jgi:cellulose synthase/poly-beta-1,6-N-acetylglucosamine synthase-like glycosyltransferase